MSPNLKTMKAHVYPSAIQFKFLDVLTNFQCSLLPTVYKLACVETFWSNEQLLARLELVRVTEVHHGQRSSSSWVMNDVLKTSLLLTLRDD